MSVREAYESIMGVLQALGEAERVVETHRRELREAVTGLARAAGALRETAADVTCPDDLVWARSKRCPCGAGLAYPKDMTAVLPGGYWDCSAVLLGTADSAVEHCGQLPWAFYSIKSERDGLTTREETP